MKLFIDSDIILDLLAKREPYYKSASELFTIIDMRQVIACSSPIIFANLHYLLRKLTSNNTALQNLRKLRTFISILSIDERIIDQALNSGFSDFEDAIQYFTAINNGVTTIITRNKSDYKRSKITVLTAEEFMKFWKIENQDSKN